MPVTPNYDLPYPSLGDPPDGPAQLRALAEATDTAIHETRQAIMPAGGRYALPNILSKPPVSQWTNWGSSLILPNVARPCLVYGWGSGFFLNDGGGSYARMRICISLDGGLTWSNGTQSTDQAGSGAATRRGGFSPVHFEQGTPSSNIMLRAQVEWSDGGLDGDPQFYDGVVVGLVLPAG